MSLPNSGQSLSTFVAACPHCQKKYIVPFYDVGAEKDCACGNRFAAAAPTGDIQRIYLSYANAILFTLRGIALLLFVIAVVAIAFGATSAIRVEPSPKSIWKTTPAKIPARDL